MDVVHSNEAIFIGLLIFVFFAIVVYKYQYTEKGVTTIDKIRMYFKRKFFGKKNLKYHIKSLNV